MLIREKFTDMTVHLATHVLYEYSYCTQCTVLYCRATSYSHRVTDNNANYFVDLTRIFPFQN